MMFYEKPISHSSLLKARKLHEDMVSTMTPKRDLSPKVSSKPCKYQGKPTCTLCLVGEKRVGMVWINFGKDAVGWIKCKCVSDQSFA